MVLMGPGHARQVPPSSACAGAGCTTADGSAIRRTISFATICTGRMVVTTRVARRRYIGNRSRITTSSRSADRRIASGRACWRRTISASQTLRSTGGSSKKVVGAVARLCWSSRIDVRCGVGGIAVQLDPGIDISMFGFEEPVEIKRGPSEKRGNERRHSTLSRAAWTGQVNHRDS